MLKGRVAFQVVGSKYPDPGIRNKRHFLLIHNFYNQGVPELVVYVFIISENAAVIISVTLYSDEPQSNQLQYLNVFQITELTYLNRDYGIYIPHQTVNCAA